MLISPHVHKVLPHRHNNNDVINKHPMRLVTVDVALFINDLLKYASIDHYVKPITINFNHCLRDLILIKV